MSFLLQWNLLDREKQNILLSPAEQSLVQVDT